MLRGLIIMSLISMQLAYIYQAREWFTVKKNKKQKTNLKYLLIAKVIVPITTGASRLTAWGPGARWRAPGGDRGGDRAVASLTVPGGQEFHFPHFSSNFDQFYLFFLKLFSFSSSFWPSGWASRPPGKALATPLGSEVPRSCWVLAVLAAQQGPFQRI